MNRIFQPFKYILVMSILMTCFAFGGCAVLSTLIKNPDYIYEGSAVLVGGDDEPIKVKDSEGAVDVTYAELIDFIRYDRTDQLEYIGRSSNEGLEPFVCSDFAEALHNNAEKSGIRAAYVSIDFGDEVIGHAINAFGTTDMGMVYVDCTGKSDYSQLYENESGYSAGSWDKIAYVEYGNPYGLIALDYAERPDYAFYEEYDRKRSDYLRLLEGFNEEVTEFNEEIENNVFIIGSTEYRYMKTWEAELIEKEEELKAMAEEIGDAHFRPLGIVSNIVVHW
jgi:hypothetical protein